MASVINTNVSSINAQRNLSSSNSSLQQALQRLSSGLRVNNAKDDAAGLAIATKMQAQSRGMEVATRNANDAISLAQTAESAISQMKDYLLRMRDLAVQSANATNTTGDRTQLGNEFDQLSAEIGRIYQQTEFNGIKVIGTGAGTNTFQVGANTGQTVTVTTTSMSGIHNTISAVNISAAASNATGAISTIDLLLDSVNSQRSVYGAAQSRFDGVVSMLAAAKENTDSAISRIMDADYASETAKLTRAQILQQAGTAMLAQANSIPNNVLTLLRG